MYCHAFALYVYLFPGGHSVKLSDRRASPRDPTPLYTLFDRIGTLSGVASMYRPVGVQLGCQRCVLFFTLISLIRFTASKFFAHGICVL